VNVHVRPGDRGAALRYHPAVTGAFAAVTGAFAAVTGAFAAGGAA